jgi:hypothetical protein
LLISFFNFSKLKNKAHALVSVWLDTPPVEDSLGDSAFLGKNRILFYVFYSVADPNPDPDPPDPHVLGPSGSGSISQRYGSRSGSGSGSRS